jgi:Flp pilus assembly protein TadG
MTLNSSPMYQRFRRFLACEDGNSTIEALFFYIPIFLFLLASIEIGILSTRHVLLERGVDLAVRQVRIGALKDADGKGPGIDTVRTAICNYSGVIPDCLDSVKIKMVKMDVRNWGTDLDGPVQCIDRAESEQVPTTFTNGANNELMVLQVCALFDQFFPTTSLSNGFAKINGGGYGLIATTSYVVEPYQ